MPGRGTLEKEKPPIFGMVQRGGAIILHLLANVRQTTIKPLLLAGVGLGSLINTDEYAIYGRLPEWGFGHKTVNHGRGEYARDEDGFCEVHVNTMEGAGQSHMKNPVGGSPQRNPFYEQRNVLTRVPLRSGTLDPS